MIPNTVSVLAARQQTSQRPESLGKTHLPRRTHVGANRFAGKHLAVVAHGPKALRE